jgi:hypothetical protein
MSQGYITVSNHSCTKADLFSRVDTRLEEEGLLGQDFVRHGIEHRAYSFRTGGPPIEVSFEFTPKNFTLAAFVQDYHYQNYGACFMSRVFARFSIAAESELGRTFVDLFECLTAKELTGGIQSVDWFQYFSANVVKRWGAEYLKKGPFYRVEEFENGAYGVWLSPTPYDMPAPEPFAEYFGIELPPLSYPPP